ncbi:Uma2 family endonuclease [soil metagenome]
MAIKEKLYTAEELLRMPDDGLRRELVEGEIRTMTPAGNEHGYLALRIGRLLGRHVDDNKLGRAYAAETGFKIASDPDTVRALDAAFVSRERLEKVGSVAGFWPGAPDLVVEVVSPGDTHAEVVEKSLTWLDAGCRMVLVAEPGRKVVTVYRSREDIRILTAAEAVDGADVVPGWSLPVAEIFA